jgi:uncharacterized protein YegP (UPF0339 family)
MPERIPTLTIYCDDQGHYRWRLTHGNGQVLAASSEGFASAGNAKRNFRQTREAMNQVSEAMVRQSTKGHIYG